MLKFVKSIFISSLLVAPALLLVQPAQAEGFGASCSNQSYDNGILRATCKTARGGEKGSEIDLNQIITNNNGWLAWRSNGGFTGSCNGARVGYDNRGNFLLVANCKKKNGKFLKNVDLNLDERINNLDGNLVPHDIP